MTEAKTNATMVYMDFERVHPMIADVQKEFAALQCDNKPCNGSLSPIFYSLFQHLGATCCAHSAQDSVTVERFSHPTNHFGAHSDNVNFCGPVHTLIFYLGFSGAGKVGLNYSDSNGNWKLLNCWPRGKVRMVAFSGDVEHQGEQGPDDAERNILVIVAPRCRCEPLCTFETFLMPVQANKVF